LQGRKIERPFYPGGDYENYKYTKESVVIDNPPFSVITKIAKFYNEKNIDYFLFAPGLTLFNILMPNDKTNGIVVSNTITFENGAKVKVGFITNLGEYKVRTAPKLCEWLKAANRWANNDKKRYTYPPNVTSAALLQKIADIPLGIKKDEIVFTRYIDDKNQQIYGGGGYISSRIAAKLKAAELKAAEQVQTFHLSAREKEIIKKIDSLERF